jgi:poly(beta-D-mannuronate) lyase
MFFQKAVLFFLLGGALCACGGGSGSGAPASSSSSVSSSTSSVSVSSASSESSVSSAQSSHSAQGVWTIYNGNYTPFAEGVVTLANGDSSQFVLNGNDGGRDAVYFNVIGDGRVSFDTTVNAAHHHYGVFNGIVRSDGIYPKTFTLIAGVTGPEQSNRALDFEIAMADEGVHGARIKAIIRADDDNTGVQLERVVPATDTSADSRQQYGLDMLGVFRVYHFAIELTAPTQGNIRVYMDGNSEPLSNPDEAVSLLITDQVLRQTTSPGQNYLRVGDMGGSGYQSTIDWIIWTDTAAYSPEELHGLLPENIGCVKGYGANENVQECAAGGEPVEREYEFDLSYWKITLPDGSERSVQWMMGGNTAANEFFYNADGSMVFRCPNISGTTANTTYSRTELREMLRGTNNSIGTQGFTKNNWVFSTSSPETKILMGGIDGNMKATLTVDQVSTTGDADKVGRVIIGQIHGSDDEPVRIYYRKLPNNNKGSIYFAHEQRGGSDSWYEMIGSRSNSASDPVDGIALGEQFSYEINVSGLQLTVTIKRAGKANVVRTITMDSAYNDDYMYFKAGVYNQNNTGLESDYVQATFYALDVTHDSP